MSDRKANPEVDLNGESERVLRKPWSPPLVIVSTMKYTEAKTPGNATPDSHFNSSNYGRS